MKRLKCQANTLDSLLSRLSQPGQGVLKVARVPSRYPPSPLLYERQPERHMSTAHVPDMRSSVLLTYPDGIWDQRNHVVRHRY